jgi:hypothetical protein
MNDKSSDEQPWKAGGPVRVLFVTSVRFQTALSEVLPSDATLN